jgi:hypothetical protein
MIFSIICSGEIDQSTHDPILGTNLRREIDLAQFTPTRSPVAALGKASAAPPPRAAMPRVRFPGEPA